MPRGISFRTRCSSSFQAFVQMLKLLYTLYTVCLVPWGDIMSTVGDILSTMDDVQYRGGYHDKCGGALVYRGGVQYRGWNVIFCYLSERPPHKISPIVLK